MRRDRVAEWSTQSWRGLTSSAIEYRIATLSKRPEENQGHYEKNLDIVFAEYSFAGEWGVVAGEDVRRDRKGCCRPRAGMAAVAKDE
jgi:hypothetical protein